MGKDLRRWARASPLINHTRLYYFPFKLPPFRWPGGGEGEEESARERVGRELAARHKGGTGVQSIAAATFTDASHLLLARGINMSAESSNRGTAPPYSSPSIVHPSLRLVSPRYLSSSSFHLRSLCIGTVALKSPFLPSFTLKQFEEV